MQSMIICSVHATAKLNNNQLHDGALSVLAVSDTHYVGQFQYTLQTSSSIINNDDILFDIDDIEYLKDRLKVCCNQVVVEFYVEDILELSILLDIIRECQEVCDATLRLQSLVKDAFYEELYSHISEEEDDEDENDDENNESDENGKVQDHRDHDRDRVIIADELLKNIKSGMIQKIFDKPSNKNHSELSISTVSSKNTKIQDIYCIYCDYMVTNPENPREYVVHPYVPINSVNDPIYMCIICVNNWKEYRDSAAQDKLLKLPGETNEEVCALCSDSPQEVVLCSKCPRSFCYTCLKRTLTSELYNKIDEDDDDNWKCMSCTRGIPPHEPLTRNKWRIFTVCLPSSSSSSSSSSTPRSIPPKGIITLEKSSNDTKKFLFSTEEAGSISTSTSVSKPISVSKATSTLVSTVISPPKIKLPSSSHQQNKLTHSLLSPTIETIPKVDKLKSNKKQTDNLKLNGNQTKVNESIIDELYYFQQYLIYYSRLCQECNLDSKKEFYTDEACFLCKDGGILIECDWTVSGRKLSQCRKVYHSDCLSYDVGDQNPWYCPRHFCDICGTMALTYACLFCPVSICSKCPEEMVRKYGHKRFVELNKPETGEFTRSKMITIACQSCLDMMIKTKERSASLNPELICIIDKYLVNEIQSFPGTPGEEYYQRGGLFKRSFEISTQESVTTSSQPKEIKSSSMKKKIYHPIRNKTYDNKDLYGSSKKVPERRLQWTEEERIDLKDAYHKYDQDLDSMLSDRTLNCSFRQRERSDIVTKLLKLRDDKNQNNDNISINDKVNSNIGDENRTNEIKDDNNNNADDNKKSDNNAMIKEHILSTSEIDIFQDISFSKSIYSDRKIPVKVTDQMSREDRSDYQTEVRKEITSKEVESFGKADINRSSSSSTVLKKKRRWEKNT